MSSSDAATKQRARARDPTPASDSSPDTKKPRSSGPPATSTMPSAPTPPSPPTADHHPNEDELTARYYRDDESNWYKRSNDYWDAVEPTVDGMLGGFAVLCPEDSRTSLEFLKTMTDRGLINTKLVLDCGAGIGRVSDKVLLKVFDQSDLLEPCTAFVDQAKRLLPEDRIGHFFNSGMEAFEPVAGREYSAIWMQWVIGYLTDEDMVRFLLTCRRILTRDGPGGMVFLKDNVGTQEHIYDESDASITRTDAHIRRLFQKAGYILVDVKPQTRFPKYMIPVNMYAYKPDPLFTEEEPTTKAPGKE